jgi:hypothetical protein
MKLLPQNLQKLPLWFLTDVAKFWKLPHFRENVINVIIKALTPQQLRLCLPQNSIPASMSESYNDSSTQSPLLQNGSWKAVIWSLTWKENKTMHSSVIPLVKHTVHHTTQCTKMVTIFKTSFQNFTVKIPGWDLWYKLQTCRVQTLLHMVHTVQGNKATRRREQSPSWKC